MFVVEGKKTVNELLASKMVVYKVFSTDENYKNNIGEVCDLISDKELSQISSLKNPSSVLGVFYIPEPLKIDMEDWVVVLDDIRDPGNLGTIIRLCDWFGIKNLLCSATTVDCYNPKVLQATMGSITRVNITYKDVSSFLRECNMPIYGTFMNGEVVYNQALPKKGVLVMGNEANGISKNIENICTNKIAIPQFGKSTTESLNVATATSILLNEIRRGNF
ncbi:RNA methyltransferase [Maribacter vaceletii]|nr:RNA methyltransferase [Maribacter vaceletii]